MQSPFISTKANPLHEAAPFISKKPDPPLDAIPFYLNKSQSTSWGSPFFISTKANPLHEAVPFLSQHKSPIHLVPYCKLLSPSMLNICCAMLRRWNRSGLGALPTSPWRTWGYIFILKKKNFAMITVIQSVYCRLGKEEDWNVSQLHFFL